MAQDYETRILRVLDYMRDNPAGDLSLDRLADVAAMSRFHWHRVFRAMTGETCAQVTRRLRMHRAADLLVHTDREPARIAASCGYGNVRSFARAFAETFGETPAAFRARGEIRAPLPDLKPSLKPSLKQGDPPMFPIEIETCPDRRVAAVPHRGAYPKIATAFAALGEALERNRMTDEARGMIAVYFDDPDAVPTEALRSYAGVVVRADVALPDPLEEVLLPAGRHAVLRHRGPYDGLPAAYRMLYGWLPGSGEEPADRPPFEVYHNTPMNAAPEDLRTDICIPLR